MKKWTLWIVLLVVVALVGFGWLALRAYLPVNPINPYFPNTDTRIGGLHWDLGEFQPIYLYSFTNKNNYFIKVAYRDPRQNIKFMDILVGQGGTNTIPFSSITDAGNNVIQIGSISEYGKHFKFGNRVHITYLLNVLKRSDDQLGIIEPTADNTKTICQSSKMLCYSITLVQANAKAFWDFPTTGSFSTNLFFPGLSLSKVLIK
jgi:hypothetical protein